MSRATCVAIAAVAMSVSVSPGDTIGSARTAPGAGSCMYIFTITRR